MFTRLAACLFLLALANPVSAQLDIKPEHRVTNSKEGYCMWASWETLGNTLGIKELKDLKRRRSQEDVGGDLNWAPGPYLPGLVWVKKCPGPTTPKEAVVYLAKLGVCIDIYEDGKVDWLLQQCRKGKGAVAIIWQAKIETEENEAHAVVVTDVVYGKNGRHDVFYYDCNYPEEIQQASGLFWYCLWTGTAMYLKEGKKK